MTTTKDVKLTPKIAGIALLMGWFPISLYMIFSLASGARYEKNMREREKLEPKWKVERLEENSEKETGKAEPHPDSNYYDAKRFNYFRLEVEFDYEGFHSEMEIRRKGNKLIDYLLEAPDVRAIRQISLRGVRVERTSFAGFDVDVEEIGDQGYFQRSHKREKKERDPK